MAKRTGSAARARSTPPRDSIQDVPDDAQRSVGRNARTNLTAVDGDASMPLELDRLIHERVRLAIVSSLAVHESLTFNELKALLQTSDGNVSVHARKLEDAGYITCSKGFDGRVPRTEYALTADGRAALEHYLSHMEALIRRVGGA